MERVLITGANRGIGLEFVRQCLARGDTVLAGARRPDEARELDELERRFGEMLHILPLDVTDDTGAR
jgi:NAD(P)-dependent dehydrogenase (short-subunit alcohol dehydrogenase family)